MATNQHNCHEQELLKLAKEKVKKIKNFYIHLLIYAIGILFYVLKEYFEIASNLFPLNYINNFTMAIWTFIIAIDAIYIFVQEVIFGKNWENRKVKRLLEKKTEKQTWN